jgi:histidinol phosphatase-like enzyme (inositol monophosphatase family)
MNYNRELEAAKKAARMAGAVQLAFRSRAKRVVRKNDHSPVTRVDKKCEEVISRSLNKTFPADGFLGEESGERKGRSGRRWIVDPLDGTRPYIRGLPTHSVLIALEDGQELAAGVVYLPAMGKLYWAQKGGGAFCNGARIRVSRVSRPGNALGSVYGLVEHHGTRKSKKLAAVMRQWDYCYGFMDVFTYMCVAGGQVDICINLCDRPWDCAAPACIVEEAGGKYSDIDGNRSVHNGSIVLSNGVLHDKVLAAFSGADR